jgi:hypothetical protein
VKPAASEKKRAEKFQWTEVAPVDPGSLRPVGRRGHRARRLVAHSEKAAPPPLIPRGEELRTLARVPVGSR